MSSKSKSKAKTVAGHEAIATTVGLVVRAFQESFPTLGLEVSITRDAKLIVEWEGGPGRHQICALLCSFWVEGGSDINIGGNEASRPIYDGASEIHRFEKFELKRGMTAMEELAVHMSFGVLKQTFGLGNMQSAALEALHEETLDHINDTRVVPPEYSPTLAKVTWIPRAAALAARPGRDTRAEPVMASRFSTRPLAAKVNRANEPWTAATATVTATALNITRSHAPSHTRMSHALPLGIDDRLIFHI